MTWYEFLLFVHVSGAIVWLGGAFLFQIHGMVELRSGDTAVIARCAGNAGRISERLFVPTSLLVVLAGIGLMIDGDRPWDRLWVIFALAAFAGSFLPGLGVNSPTAKRIEVVGPESREGQRLIQRIFALARIELMFLFAIVFAMTVKPTTDDVWTVLIVTVALVVGTAFSLRGVRGSADVEAVPTSTV